MKTAKTKKPYPEFPLFAHQVGQWAKKIKGRTWYFGVLDDPDGAMERYTAQVHEIQAGRDPRRTRQHVSSAELSVYDMANLYLARQQDRVNAGEITGRHFGDCIKTCGLIIDHFGKFQSAASLRVADFQKLRSSFPETWGPQKTSTETARVKAAFRWAAASELIPGIPNFGPDFKRTSAKVSRRDQQQRQAGRGG